jgi:hypothetical protein
MSLKVSDLVTAIQGALNSGLSSHYSTAGTAVPAAPAGVNQSELLSDLSTTDLQNVVTYSVSSKWRVEAGANRPLRIKGAEMIKAVTGLEATEPE